MSVENKEINLVKVAKLWLEKIRQCGLDKQIAAQRFVSCMRTGLDHTITFNFAWTLELIEHFENLVFTKLFDKANKRNLAILTCEVVEEIERTLHNLIDQD